MSVWLLDRTRKIGRMLHNMPVGSDIFPELCATVSDILHSNAWIVDLDGKVLGMNKQYASVLSGDFFPKSVGEEIAPILNERFLGTLSTKENVNLMTLGFSVLDSRKYKAMLVPFDIAEARVGTMFLYREGEEYSIDDIILAEYVAVVAGLEMQQSLQERQAKLEQKRQSANAALRMLSYAEQEAITAVFEEIGDGESLLVTSRVAQKSGITRSVIVNALRKFESSGILEIRSLGMKGTKIRVLNEEIYEKLKELH